MSEEKVPEDATICETYVQINENYRNAHKNIHCLKAAQFGEISAQYSVGLGYHSDNDFENALKYYRLAAEGGAIEAYLTLGHFLLASDEKEAVLWYKKYISAMMPQEENGGAGYVALRLARHFHEKSSLKSSYWLSVCMSTTYREHCEL